MSSRGLRLYRNLLRSAGRLQDHNYQSYAVRNIRNEFKKNKDLTERDAINECFARGNKELEVIERYSILQKLYFRGDFVNHQI